MSDGENWLNERAAGQLARRIEHYWRQRGQAVRVWLERCPGMDDAGGPYVVRSDMIDGLPRGER